MADEVVKVEAQGTQRALVRFGAAIMQKAQLLKSIATAQLVSIRRTFREQGSPANSWAPLAPSTLRNSKSKASAGRKILILSGRLLNSIQASSADDSVALGTNLVYARVQQEGSADYSGSPIGPQAKIPGRSVTVGKHTRGFLREIHYGTREVNVNGVKHHVPVAMRSGMRSIVDSRGRRTTVRAAYQGPRQLQRVEVSQHERHQNIPARPYLIFRPEDPDRISGLVIDFVKRGASGSGLQLAGAI